MTGTELKEMVKEANAKREKVRKAYREFDEIAREAREAEKKVMTAKARFFASINKPMTAREISNLVDGAISKHSVAGYFALNENKDRIGGYCNSVYTPNGKTLRCKRLYGMQKLAVLDDNDNPTDIIVYRKIRKNVYWAE